VAGWVSDLRHNPAALPPGKRHGTYCTGGLVGLAAGLNGSRISRPLKGFEPRTAQSQRVVVVPTILFRPHNNNNNNNNNNWSTRNVVLVARLLSFVAGLLATSQYPECPAIGHLGTGSSWFPCVYKRMLRWSLRFLVASHVALPSSVS